MKAIVQERYGSPDGLALREIEKPPVGDDDVLVRVHAASLNFADWHLMKRLPHFIARAMGVGRSRIRGSDLAGVVEAVGKNVGRWKPGDEVFGVARGSLAEFATTSEVRLAAKPSNLTFEQAAALPVAGVTALQGLRDKACLTPGQRVLIHGAGGGVGSFAVQIAKALGGEVTAVSTTRNLDALRRLGADHVVDYTKEDFTKRGKRYDILFDISGDRSFAHCRRVLAPGGIHVMAGGGNTVPGIVSRLLQAQLRSRIGRQRVGPFMAKLRNEDLVVLKELAEAGKLTSLVDRTYPLSEAADALRYLGTRRVRGKVVVKVA